MSNYISNNKCTYNLQLMYSNDILQWYSKQQYLCLKKIMKRKHASIWWHSLAKNKGAEIFCGKAIDYTLSVSILLGVIISTKYQAQHPSNNAAFTVTNSLDKNTPLFALLWTILRTSFYFLHHYLPVIVFTE